MSEIVQTRDALISLACDGRCPAACLLKIENTSFPNTFPMFKKKKKSFADTERASGSPAAAASLSLVQLHRRSFLLIFTITVDVSV